MFKIGKIYNALPCTRTCKGVVITFPTHRPKDFESTTKRLLSLGMSTETVTAYWHKAIVEGNLKEPYTYQKARAEFFRYLAPRIPSKAVKVYDAVVIRQDRRAVVEALSEVCGN